MVNCEGFYVVIIVLLVKELNVCLLFLYNYIKGLEELCKELVLSGL